MRSRRLHVKGHRCRHNMNYWEFGDYLGIGAGAHAKISFEKPFRILRQQKHKLPKNYLAETRDFCSLSSWVNPDERAFEFMLNAARLVDGSR